MGRIVRLVDAARRLPPSAIDSAIALTTFVQSLLFGIPPVPQLALQAVASAGVALRRTNLLAACFLVVVAHLGGVHVDSTFIALPVLILLFTVAECRGLGASIVALVVSCLLPMAGWHHCCMRHAPFEFHEFVESIYPYLALVWFAGRAQARRRGIADQLESGVEELEAERERLARAAVDEERSRIAQDLHSLVLRGVERMRGTTREAKRLLQVDLPEACAKAAAIESTGRSTLVEMRRLLNVLRRSDDLSTPGTDVAEGSDSVADPDAHMALGEPLSQPPLSDSVSEWFRRWIAVSTVTDGLLVAGLTILALTEPVFAPSDFRPVPFLPLGLIALVVLPFRKRFPLVVLAAVTVELFVVRRLPGFGWTVERSMFVVVFTLAALGGVWWGLTGVIGEVIASLPWPGLPPLRDPAWWGNLWLWITVYLLVVAGGVAIRSAARLNAERREQTDLLRRTREERVRLAVVGERLRVARDLHDVVAHALTVMVVQAGAARVLAAKDPGRAMTALDAVESIGRRAIGELASLVRKLGPDDPPTTDLSQPSDRSIAALIALNAANGVRVELLNDCGTGLMDAGLELAVYRIVQEALTNVRRHAPAARVWVKLTCAPDGVTVDVTDSGPARQDVPLLWRRTGLGLIGIAERAAIFGGSAEAGPTPEGGFRVTARLLRESVLV